MNNFVVDYRDPIFGIILIFLIIFIASFYTYIETVLKNKKSNKEYKKLLNKFDLKNLDEKDYIHLYSTYKLPFDSILLLASTFLHKGDNNKAISVYLALLEHVKEKDKKEKLLELLGATYFKSGFLQRSEKIYLKIIKFNAHNIAALYSLLLIYEKLNNYNMCKEIIDSLSQLNENMKEEDILNESLRLINNIDLSFEDKTKKLVEIFDNNRLIERLLVKYLLTYNKEYFFKSIKVFDLSKVLDLLWYLDFDDINFQASQDNKLLNELYTAKGYLNTATTSEILDLSILIATNAYQNDINIDLNFDFVCNKCKINHPIYANRCPNCNAILSLKVTTSLAKSNYEKNSSLQ